MGTINRHHENRIFSNYSYAAFLNNDFKIEFSDNDELFRRIVVAHTRLKEKLKNTEKGGTVVHYFLYKGIYHRATISAVSSGGYFCRIAREITDDELKLDDLFEFIDELSHSCLNVLNFSDEIKRYGDITDYNEDYFHQNLDFQKKETMGMYSRCQNFLKIFNDKSNEEFIPLHKYLVRTFDIIRFATRRSPKKISLFADTVFPATKLNYSKFELAVFNLVKFALIHSADTERPLLFIKRDSLKEISVETEFRLNPDFSFSESKLEMHIIKHLFRELGGHFEFSEEGCMMYAGGRFEAEFSLDERVIPADRNIEYTNEPNLKEKKAASNRYVKIYQNGTSKNKMLSSNITGFSDVEDKYVGFAEMFFGEI